MRRISRWLVVAIFTAGLVSAPPAAGHVVTRQHAKSYERAYHAVASKFGRRVPGRNIVKDGLAHRAATDADVVKSLAVLQRMLAPPPAPVRSVVATTSSAVSTSTASSPTSYVAAPSSGLEACIIQHESGGNPQATNGQYGGIGQWSPSRWASDGGTKYASTPQGATYAQQQQVLAGEGTTGMSQQQGQFDGCG